MSNQARIERLTNEQLKTTLSYLYDGEYATHRILLHIHTNYLRGHHVLLWLVRNKIRGTKLIEFFQNESHDLDGGGLLAGVTYILGKLDDTEHKRIKANELLPHDVL